MRISDWSSDVCSSDLPAGTRTARTARPVILGSDVLDIAQPSACPMTCTVSLVDVSGLAGGWVRNTRRDDASRSEERRVGKECVRSVDLGGRRIIKKKTAKAESQ